MNLYEEYLKYRTRRQFFKDCTVGVGSLGLASLLNERLFAADTAKPDDPVAPKKPHFPAKAKSIIYLHMAGAPSTLDHVRLQTEAERTERPAVSRFVHPRPKIRVHHGRKPKLLGSPHKFAKYGQSGQEMSSIVPHLATVADELCIIRSMHTDQFNHAPAQLFVHTGSPRLGRPGMGAWLSYGLGTENRNLPSFVVLVSGTAAPDGGASLWGSGFLPTIHQGVQFRSQGDPVLFLSQS